MKKLFISCPMNGRTNDEINDWAEQFLETWWEEEEDQKLMNHAVKELKK